jgi:expansin
MRSGVRWVLAVLVMLGAGVFGVSAAGRTVHLPLINVSARSVVGGPIDPAQVHRGEGTYYTFADGRGACGFDPVPGDLLVAAINAPDYTPSGAAAAWCGAYVRVSGPNGSVVVRIVDQCPECKRGDLDLSPQAFEQIAPLIQGRVPISWTLQSPALDRPIQYRIKDGSNPYWIAVQIRNHRNPILRVELRQPDGSYQVLPRQDYNFFITQSSQPRSSIALRVTDIYGRQISDSGIVAESTTSGSAQFPAP